MPSNERTPLLEERTRNFWSFGQDVQDDYHTQFCHLVGIPPSNLPHDEESWPIGPKTLYGRALKMKRNQSTTYAITAGVSNILLLMQVVLGAAVTGLGASESSHILITLFGATNTIIAGVVAYLKSRGQPMRARMYRDDLERVVDEIENSEIMWLGISKGMHGYEDINTDEDVTVRSEVARLTRLYNRAIRTNTINNPDMYMAGGNSEGSSLVPRKVPAPLVPISTVPDVAAPTGTTEAVPAPAPAPAPVVKDPDESPASAPPKPAPKEEPKSTAEPVPDAKTPADGAATDTAKDTTASPTDATPKPSSTTDAAKNGDAKGKAPKDDNLLLDHDAAGTPDTKKPT